MFTPELASTLMGMVLGGFLKLWQKSLEQKELTAKLLAKERGSIDESMDKASKRMGDYPWWSPQALTRPIIALYCAYMFFYPTLGIMPVWVESCDAGGVLNFFKSLVPWAEVTQHCEFKYLTPGGITILEAHKQVALTIVGFLFGNRAVK